MLEGFFNFSDKYSDEKKWEDAPQQEANGELAEPSVN